jgi:hypothetical protein
MEHPLAYLDQVELPLAAQGQHAPLRALFLYRGWLAEAQFPAGFYIASLRSVESAAHLTERTGYQIDPLQWTYRRHRQDIERQVTEIPSCIQDLLAHHRETLLTTRSHFLTCWKEDLTHVCAP